MSKFKSHYDSRFRHIKPRLLSIERERERGRLGGVVSRIGVWVTDPGWKFRLLI